MGFRMNLILTYQWFSKSSVIDCQSPEARLSDTRHPALTALYGLPRQDQCVLSLR